MWLWELGSLIELVLLYKDSKALKRNGSISSGYPLLVFCKIDIEIRSLLALLLFVDYPIIHHSIH